MVEHLAKNDAREGGRRVLDRMVEFSSKRKVCEGVGESVHILIKRITKGEVSEVGWEVVEWFVESWCYHNNHIKSEVCQSLGESINLLVETIT